MSNDPKTCLEGQKGPASLEKAPIDSMSIRGVGVGRTEPITANTFEERQFSLISVIGIGYSVTNSAMAILASLATGIGSGGPVLLIWGQVGIALISICIAITLGEFASAMPHAAGQMYWVSKLAPERLQRPLAYLTGMMSWASSFCIVASGCLLTPQMVIGMYMLERPDFVYQRWMGFVGFQAINLVAFFFNTVERFIPTFSRASMGLSIITTIVIFVTILTMSPRKQTGTFVFADFVNLSGWNDVVAAFTGILGINWGYSCLDACTHMAEEIPRPEKNIPKALLSTVIVGIATAIPMTVALLFCITDIVAVVNTATMVPSLEMFMQAGRGNTAMAIGLQSLIAIVFFGSIFGAQTWQSRLCWAFARQGGLPLSKHLGAISPHPFSVPLWAHVVSCLIVSALGFIYLGSVAAFNAFVSCGLFLQYATYTICVICLFIRGRSNFAHGPFWWPRLGPVCQIVTVCWTIFCLVMYSFPPYKPTTPTNMTYASVVFVAIILLTGFAWLFHGRKSFVCL